MKKIFFYLIILSVINACAQTSVKLDNRILFERIKTLKIILLEKNNNGPEFKKLSIYKNSQSCIKFNDGFWEDFIKNNYYTNESMNGRGGLEICPLFYIDQIEYLSEEHVFIFSLYLDWQYGGTISCKVRMMDGRKKEIEFYNINTRGFKQYGLDGLIKEKIFDDDCDRNNINKLVTFFINQFYL